MGMSRGGWVWCTWAGLRNRAWCACSPAIDRAMGMWPSLMPSMPWCITSTSPAGGAGLLQAPRVVAWAAASLIAAAFFDSVGAFQMGCTDDVPPVHDFGCNVVAKLGGSVSFHLAPQQFKLLGDRRVCQGLLYCRVQ